MARAWMKWKGEGRSRMSGTGKDFEARRSGADAKAAHGFQDTNLSVRIKNSKSALPSVPRGPFGNPRSVAEAAEEGCSHGVFSFLVFSTPSVLLCPSAPKRTFQFCSGLVLAPYVTVRSAATIFARCDKAPPRSS